jgi:transposase
VKPKQGKKGSGRRRGAQPGHRGNLRLLVPPDRVAHSEDCLPPTCRRCGDKLVGEDTAPYRHQVTDVRKPEVFVNEWRQHTLCCSGCGTETTGRLPDGVPWGNFGPRVTSTVSLLTGRYRASKRLAREMMQDLFGVDISLGAISRCEQITSEAIRSAVSEAREFVKTRSVKHADETGWAEGEHRDRAWLWTVTVGAVTVFLIHRNRSANAARKLLGKVFGVLVTDRWTAYTWWPLALRQLCWAHLTRDFQAFVDAGGEARPIGEKLLDCKDRLFAWWGRVKDGKLTRSILQGYVASLRLELRALLEAGTVCSHKKTRGTCAEMLKVEPAFWTFVSILGVEPTNNNAERVIRPAVIWRKLSFGTHSHWGSRFVERILTVCASLRQQKVNVVEYVHDAVERHLRGQAFTSLLPQELSTSNVAAPLPVAA